jgi:hypothetical protein
VAGSCEYGDEPAGSGATEFDSFGRSLQNMLPYFSAKTNSQISVSGNFRNTSHLSKEYHKMPVQTFVLSLKFTHFCEISSSHGGEYDVHNCLLGYTAV